jgi:hypothetical protein
MGKFYGPIGYAESKETSPGVWVDSITERHYRGDIIRSSRSWSSGESVNDNLKISNDISIIADPFAYQNIHNMKYITWMGADWKISKIDIQRPRLLLTIGEVYNGSKPEPLGGG